HIQRVYGILNILVIFKANRNRLSSIAIQPFEVAIPFFVRISNRQIGVKLKILHAPTWIIVRKVIAYAVIQPQRHGQSFACKTPLYTRAQGINIPLVIVLSERPKIKWGFLIDTCLVSQACTVFHLPAVLKSAPEAKSVPRRLTFSSQFKFLNFLGILCRNPFTFMQFSDSFQYVEIFFHLFI